MTEVWQCSKHATEAECGESCRAPHTRLPGPNYEQVYQERQERAEWRAARTPEPHHQNRHYHLEAGVMNWDPNIEPDAIVPVRECFDRNCKPATGKPG